MLMRADYMAEPHEDCSLFATLPESRATTGPAIARYGCRRASSEPQKRDRHNDKRPDWRPAFVVLWNARST
jgi:hypothetical protein